MKKLFFYPLFFILFFLLSPTVIPNNNVYAASCDKTRITVNPSNVPQGFQGTLSIGGAGIGDCFQQNTTYRVVAYPQGKSNDCLNGPGDLCNVATWINSETIQVNADFSVMDHKDIQGPWTLLVCQDGNACNIIYLQITINYGSTQQPLPQIQPNDTSSCAIWAGNDMSFPISNLQPSQTYGYYWTDECNATVPQIGKGTIDCSGLLGYRTKGTFLATNSVMTVNLSDAGRDNIDAGRRTICVDGYGLQRHPPVPPGGFNSAPNCVTVTISAAQPSPALCQGVTPTPPSNTDCNSKYNGTCVHQGRFGQPTCPKGLSYLPNPNPAQPLCGFGIYGACCANPVCGRVNGTCGDQPGDPYCCDLTKTVCNIGQSTHLGTCIGCSREGGICGSTGNACCTGNNLTCNTNTNKCQVCKNTGDTCDPVAQNCCSGNNNCTNGGKCVDACTEGMSCKTDAQCCAGAKCTNGACAINTNATPTIIDPSFPPVNWCQNGNCNTALGSWPYDPSGFIKTLFAIVLSLAGAIAVITIIYAGYVYMTSQGNPERVQHAQELITASVVGLLFTIFSFVILQAIGVDILHIPGISP